MNWSDVLEEPTLQNLPFKIEMNEWGKIVLSPASNKHGILQAEIVGFLRDQRKAGKIITECSIHTAKGVKVADIAWASSDFFKKHGFDTPYVEAPEICIEIISPSNSTQEMQEKTTLYLSKGAKEVWVCDENGLLLIYSLQGLLEYSNIFPNFPKHIEF